MDSKPLVSVLMTAYNREKYIAAAIESVLNSTYQNWELIITDDQSKDSTFDLAISYAQKDSRIKVFKNEVNLKDYPNRNRAASYAQGKYLKYLDADDLIYPHGLEVMVRCMEDNPSAALGLTVNNSISQKNPLPALFTPKQSFERHFLGFGMFTTGPTGSIIRRDVFVRKGGFQIERFAGDLEFWLRVSEDNTILMLPKDLFWWREHEDQQIKISHTAGTADVLYYKILKQYLEKDTCPLDDTFRLLAIKKLKRRFCLNLIRMAFSHKSPIKAFQMKKESQITLCDFFKSAILDKRVHLDYPV